MYAEKSGNPLEYTTRLDREYSRYAGLYDRAVKLLPLWKTWIKTVISCVCRVLQKKIGYKGVEPDFRQGAEMARCRHGAPTPRGFS
ncbi:MAG: hypothetical protein JRD68_12785, partial [Deltaproteobacteria bacterium]|nr:hypothetical protein [Deltaproteobacteria bacterium]